MGSVAVIEPHEGTPNDYVHVYPPQKANVSPATESSGSQPIDGHSVKANGIPHVVENSEGPSSHVVEPVAIIGMAMRLPGGVNNAESFWDLLVNKRDGRCQVPSNRYNVDAWYDPDKPGHVGTKYGYFLEDLNLANMDVGFWSMVSRILCILYRFRQVQDGSRHVFGVLVLSVLQRELYLLLD